MAIASRPSPAHRLMLYHGPGSTLRLTLNLKVKVVPTFMTVVYIIVTFISACDQSSANGIDVSPAYSLWGNNKFTDRYSVKYSDIAILHGSPRNKRQSTQGTTSRPMIINERESHQYYSSSYISGDPKYYIDLETEESFTVIPHWKLSDSHLTAAVVNLPFTFTFYGHNVTKAYIATGGFIYLGTVFHELIAATQYVAPLMGNFDPSINDSAIIRYANNGTAFTVEWNGVHVQHNIEAGSFTFQTTLMKDGRIIFAYKHIPTSPLAIDGGNGHKVTVGVSDGFYIEDTTNLVRYIYRYHVVELAKELVIDKSAFILTPLPTCNQQSGSCEMCLGNKLADFDCGWCSALNTCSSGFDRNRQEWIDAGCDQEKHTDVAHCPTGISAGSVIGGIVGALGIILVCGFLLWIIYGYTHPTSRSGLALIEFRHFFKKDSTRNVSDEDRYAVTISGDIQGNSEANGNADRMDNEPLADGSTGNLSAGKVAEFSTSVVSSDVQSMQAISSATEKA
ncbi:plexin domain-containing protein 2-like [Acanthaster planci]|uniref:Plexin domain-containing protein 2-like n=1 Tax=Acanthaster planci TaxID=133434 RepID=A0A8B7Z2T5_ACAPL|nr:plexin domain-containing protein 2-like [Acanthaster planci]